MNIALSLLMPLAFTLTALLHRAHAARRRHLQRRSIVRIAEVISGRRAVAELGHTSPKVLHSSLYTVINTLRGEAVDEAIRIGERYNIRFHAILRRPDHAIVHISKVKRPLSLCEAAHLTAALIANNSPVAYTPLLSSRNRNLQLIGLNLVYHFGFTDAEPLVQRMTTSAEDTISELALHTLCAINGNICTRRVAAHFAAMHRIRRRATLRHLVNTCYSTHSVAHLLTAQELHEFEGRVSSYKCSILCS